MLQVKSRIQFERQRKKETFMSDYERLRKEGLSRSEVFHQLALIHGYSDKESARVTYYRWKLELENKNKK